MKQFLLLFSLVSLFTLTASAQAVYHIDLSVFPKPQKGYVQYVIHVPHSVGGQDQQKKVEFYIGKYTEVDKCNSFSLIGEIVEKDLQGFGYPYYEFQTKGDVMGTMMGCMDKERITKFVSSQPHLTNYNGRLPIVIYVPEGYEVRYKIYQADKDEYSAVLMNNK